MVYRLAPTIKKEIKIAARFTHNNRKQSSWNQDEKPSLPVRNQTRQK
jgi:hypothetical protein